MPKPSTYRRVPLPGPVRRGAGWWKSLLVVLAVFALPSALRAQAPLDSAADDPHRGAWRLVVDGSPHPWGYTPEGGPGGTEAEQVQAAARAALAALQQAGHYLARVDSFVVAPGDPPRVTLFATAGPIVRVGQVHLLGVERLDAPALARDLETRPGVILDADVLEEDVRSVLARYASAGYPLARVEVGAVALRPGEPPRLDVTLVVHEGASPLLERVELTGAERTRARYVMRLAGLREGRRLRDYDADEIRRRLEETGFFAEVGVPELLALGDDSSAVVRIPLREASPGSFDLVLGYVPARAPATGGTVVGNGHLELRNLFGGGRVMGLRLNRLPGQVSSVDVRAADPFVLGTPLRAELRFEGLQQDSTYARQRYRAEGGYRFAGGLELFASVAREATRPGQAGVRVVNGQQRVPRAGALFVGFGVRYRRLDRLVSPRRGLWVETNLEQGHKDQSFRTMPAGTDTTLLQTARLRQERLELRARVYRPLHPRHVLAAGGEAAVLLSDSYDVSDLFRLGGATSLRGYNEDRFVGRYVGRALLEYRYLLDRASFVFAFFDLGYVDLPALEERPGEAAFYPGYGAGVQFETALGLLNASYAVNPEDGPARGRIHVGLSFGL